MAKVQLGVIFGSRSCEREVSIISAVQLMNHVDSEKYDVIPVYIGENGVWYTGNALRRIETYTPFDPNKAGIEAVALDVTAGSGVAGSAIGMDKIMMKQFFRGAGTLPCLPDCWFTRAMYQQDKNAVLDKVEKELGYPVFVKPANLGSSIGVSRADDREGLTDSLELAFEYDRRVLVEKGLDHPIELNCSVLGYDGDVEASPIEMPLSGQQFLDFKEKYLANGGSKGMASLHRVLPAPIEDSLRDKIQAMSCDIFRMLDCKGVVRIDYMFDRASEQVYITEINTIPGSLAFYLWENKGVKYSQLIDRMVDCARKANEDRNMRNYAYSSDILKGVSLGGAKGAKGSKGSKF